MFIEGLIEKNEVFIRIALLYQKNQKKKTNNKNTSFNF